MGIKKITNLPYRSEETSKIWEAGCSLPNYRAVDKCCSLCKFYRPDWGGGECGVLIDTENKLEKEYGEKWGEDHFVFLHVSAEYVCDLWEKK